MNSKTAVERIMKVLGLTQSKFYEAKTEQGMAMKMEGELEVGQPIYISTEEGYIPAPPGIHKLDDGTELEVDDAGKVSKIKMVSEEDEIAADERKETPEEAKTEKEQMSIEMAFGDVKLKDGTIVRMEGEGEIVGRRLKKVGYDGTLSAISDGEYETSDGKVIQIVGGAIKGVQSVADNAKRGTGFDDPKINALADIGKATANVFTEAKTVEGGIKLDSPTFDIGEPIDVVKEDGTKEKAPDGEHEIILKDEKGNDVKIRVVVADGMITERENVEELSKEDEMTEIASMFAAALKKFETKIDAIATKQAELDNKFIKFSKEPAGSRVFTQKIINEEINPLATKYEGFRRLREAMIKN